MNHLLKLLLAGALFLPFTVKAEVTAAALSRRMSGVSPDVQNHLTEVLRLITPLENGKFLFSHVSPEVTFQAKPMAQLGVANTSDTITLESLRLENSPFPERTERQKKAKLCFTAEILSHEMLHNAQFRAGLSRYPASFSGVEGVICEKLLELQAKYFGDKTFSDLRDTPDFQEFVQPKAGLYLVIRRGAKEPVKAYFETLWCNRNTPPSGLKLYREQLREIHFWNRAYAEQAFRNNYGRFLAALPGAGETALALHLQKIIDFLALPLSAEFLIRNAPVRAIPHGLACYENGVKVMELEAVADGYVKRFFSGRLVREQRVRIRR